MDQKQINGQIFLLLQDLCKHFKQTNQSPSKVLTYFLQPNKKTIEYYGFEFMIQKIFPLVPKNIIINTYQFIIQKYQSNSIQPEQFEQLMKNVEKQLSQQELNQPIQSKYITQDIKQSQSQPVSNQLNNSNSNRSTQEIIEYFVKRLQEVQIELLELFDKYDQNHDHKMNKQEFIEMFLKVVKSMQQNEQQQLIYYFFNQNEEITAFQFIKACRPQNNLLESNIYENANQAHLLKSNIQFQEIHINDYNIVAMKEFHQRFEQLKQTKQQYTDLTFPPNQESLGPSKSKFKWKRISQLFNKEPNFFVKENTNNRFGLGKWIGPDDLQQGQLGDCYFLASISALGNRRPDLLLDVFITRTFNNQGLYGVKLCIDGEWKAIGLDDYIPITEYNQPAFTKGKNNEIWVIILEKAWAKVFGSYEQIHSGFPTEVLKTLTGAPTKSIFTKDNDFLKNFEESVNQRCIMVGSTKSDNKLLENVGLVAGHAYSILKFKCISDKIKLIKMRNPWGKEEWKGDWSDQSNLWTNQLKQQLKISNINDGIFYMNIDDFLKYFSDVSICYVKDHYYDQSYNLQMDKKHSQYFTFQVNQNGIYYISINQQNQRFKNSFNYSPVRLLLFKELTLIISKNSDVRESWISSYLEIGQIYTIIIKANWQFHQQYKLNLSFYGPTQVNIQRIQKIPNFLEQSLLQKARIGQIKSYQNYPDIFKGDKFDMDLGYGYYYVKNNSDKLFSSTIQIMKMEGLKLRKPYRGNKLEIEVKPFSEFICLFSVCHNHYGFALQEQFIVKSIQ